jgi:hypothetical protein
MTKYQVVGLPNPIELSFPLAHDIIPPSQTNQRPGITRQTPGFWVQHETDNHAVGADAAMHAKYLSQGAEGRQASWHFTVDDGIAYQHIPVDEVTWQAADGGGPGNMSGISCEMCVNADGDKAKARANAEELCAAICRAEGLGADRVKRHYDFNQADPNRHHCPDLMISENYWPTFVANVAKRLTPTPTGPQPVPIPWTKDAIGVQTIGDSKALAMLGELTAARDVPLRQTADSKAPVIHRMKAGDRATCRGTFRSANGTRWDFVEYEPGKVGRALWSAFNERYPTL